MKAWQEAVAAALMGTARAPDLDLADAGGMLPRLLRQLEPDGPERRLLGTAAVLSLWQQAGFRPAALADALPEPAALDERSACSAEAARHLGEILVGDRGVLLEEWLGALAAAGQVLPHRWLPELLDQGRKRPALRPLLLPVLGRRGQWLAARNPEWALLDATPEAAPEEVWEAGSQEARLALLERLRATDPARARELLASTWAQEGHAGRAAFLAVFATGLEPGDEAFLEAALDDRRKEVRTVAADLLARLPGSGLGQRMQARLFSLLELERGFLGREKLQVSLPPACEPAMVRDGVVERPERQLGERSWWLLQILAAVPPAACSQRLGKQPAELMRLATNHEHEAVLLEGWRRAVARHPEAGWAQALLQQWLERPWLSTYGLTTELEPLCAAVPQEWLERLLAAQLRASPGSLSDAHPSLAVVRSYRRPWGEALTQALISVVPALAGRPHEAGVWHVALPGMALYAAPALAGEAERRWPSGTAWAKDMDRFLGLLRFRRDMLQALR